MLISYFVNNRVLAVNERIVHLIPLSNDLVHSNHLKHRMKITRQLHDVVDRVVDLNQQVLVFHHVHLETERNEKHNNMLFFVFIVL